MLTHRLQSPPIHPPSCSRCRKKLGCYQPPLNFTIDTVFSSCYCCLVLRLTTDPRHVLRRLFPEVKSTSYNLRPRAHCFVLPTKDTRNFIPRMLYEKIYCK